MLNMPIVGVGLVSEELGAADLAAVFPRSSTSSAGTTRFATGFHARKLKDYAVGDLWSPLPYSAIGDCRASDGVILWRLAGKLAIVRYR